MARFPLEEALEYYGIPHWGGGYFGINDQGQLTVRPTRDAGSEVALAALVREVRMRGLETPLIFRFPQILEGKVEELAGAFKNAIEEFNFKGGEYRPIFPIKVNQQRDVVEALLAAGYKHGLGIEAGSRAEFMAALSLDLPPTALTIVNGYKDLETVRLGILGARMGRRVVLVMEKLFEVDVALRAFETAGPGALPEIGFRVKLFARGAGRWQKSTGVTAKFGLSTASLLEGIQRIKEAGYLEQVSLIHFHIGSQIPEIRRLKGAIKEVSRIYAKLRRRGIPISAIDVGGGLAVDYDGSKTASDASCNYSVNEYANDVVYTVGEVCQEEKVPMPLLLSESGRYLTAAHSLLVANVVGRITADPPPQNGIEDDRAARPIKEMRSMLRDLSAKNYIEYYHDAVELRDEALTLFNVGLIGLEDRALVEGLFWEIGRRSISFAKREKLPNEEFEELERQLHEKYVVNFSVFQSTPDHWALEQLFPVVPISRLREQPTNRAALVDITCDSDGEIDRFVDIKDVKETIALHDLPSAEASQPYDLAICLLGAYQDVMGDMHNLFGAPDEVTVSVGAHGRHEIVRVERGDTVAGVLRIFGYHQEEMTRKIRERLAARVSEGQLSEREMNQLLDGFCALFTKATYLSLIDLGVTADKS
jgi:arginine decarboxylase